MSSDREDKLREQLKNAAPKRSGSGKVVSIQGDRNVVGDNNTVISTPKVVERPRYEERPGYDHVGPEQRAVLKDLVDEIVVLEANLKRAPKSYAVVWKALNRYCRVPKYSLIPIERFDKAATYLRRWKGRLQAARSAPGNDPTWRRSRYAYIHTNCKKLGLAERMRDMIAERFGASSLKELSDEELDSTYHVIAGWKRGV